MPARSSPASPKSLSPSLARNGTDRGSLGSAPRVRRQPMASDTKILRCAIYTRKSTEHGLDQEFNSLDAQREACEAYIRSQAFQGWKVLPHHYDDGAYSGGNLERPALKRLLHEIQLGKVDVVVVYKI